jgi:hypothetical protein
VAFNDPTEPMGGTGSVQPLPDGSGRVLALMNDFKEAGISSDPQLRTWTGTPLAYELDTARSYRDTARPLQSEDGSWFSHVGCNNGGGQAAICQFRAQNKQLSNWTFDRQIYGYNKTLFGRDANFGEVPDFYPMESPSGKTRHVLQTCTVRQPGIAGARCPPECNGVAACCNLNAGWIVHAVEYAAAPFNISAEESLTKSLLLRICPYIYALIFMSGAGTWLESGARTAVSSRRSPAACLTMASSTARGRSRTRATPAGGSSTATCAQTLRRDRSVRGHTITALALQFSHGNQSFAKIGLGQTRERLRKTAVLQA